MKAIGITVELEDQIYLAYEAEARRRGVTVKDLVEDIVRGLIREMEQEEREGTDHPVFP